MGKIIFQISYEIVTDKRDEYLRLIDELKAHLVHSRKKNYSVFEVQGKKNSFVEEYICESQEEFDALEDDLDEKTEVLNARIQEMTVDGKARYATLKEVS
jgi:cytochrome c556